MQHITDSGEDIQVHLLHTVLIPLVDDFKSGVGRCGEVVPCDVSLFIACYNRLLSDFSRRMLLMHPSKWGNTSPENPRF